MDFLITSYWYQAEAAKQHITITDAQVQKIFDAEKNQQFPTAGRLPDLPHPVRPDAPGHPLPRPRHRDLVKKLRAKHPSTVTAAQIQAYYTSHTSQFGTPESRNIRIVRTNDAKTGRRRQDGARSGQSWTVVAKKYSVDTATKNKGGLLVGVTKGQEEQALDTAAFSAPVNKVLGPIHGPFGYYVFEVTEIKTSTQQTLAQATPLIKQILQGQTQTSAQTAVDNQAKKAWLSKTKCRSTYAMADCSGYKAPKTSSTTAPATGATGAGDRASAGSTAPGGDRRRRRPRRRRSSARARRRAGDRTGARAARRDHPAAAQGMPVGSRAGRAHDRPAHGRGGLRARRRRVSPRRRQAARRARRRPLPGALPVAAARGARRRRPGPGRRALHREADPPPPARVRRGRGARPRRRCCATGTRSSRASRAASRASSARCRRTSPAPLYARKVQRRAASSGFDFPGVEGPLQSVRDELDELEARRDARGALPRARRRAVRGGQRRAQAEGRSGARAARGLRPLPRSRRRRRASSPQRKAEAGTISAPTSSSPTTPAPARCTEGGPDQT